MSRLHPAFEGEPPILGRENGGPMTATTRPNLRLAIVSALEALEAGDYALAVEAGDALGQLTTCRKLLRLEIGDLRAALVKIMEAIEDGDVAYAYAIADAALGLEEAA
jgi:hypothetical protein